MLRGVISEIESELKVSLPEDFVEISKFYDGTGLNFPALHPFLLGVDFTTPLTETQRLRKAVDLPKSWLVLGEPAESLLLMDCNAGGRVIWIDAFDAGRVQTQEFFSEPTVWNSFGDFFEYLLEEEEEDRK